MALNKGQRCGLGILVTVPEIVHMNTNTQLSNTVEPELVLRSRGHELDTRPEAFGFLHEFTLDPIAHAAEARAAYEQLLDAEYYRFRLPIILLMESLFAFLILYSFSWFFHYLGSGGESAGSWLAKNFFGS